MTPRYTYIENLLIVLLFSVSVLLTLFSISDPVWLDEAISALIAKESFSSIIEKLKSDSHPPVFHLIKHSALSLFGDSAVAIRIPSLTFHILTLVLLLVIGARHTSRLGGTVSATLYAISPLVIYQSSNARPYALLSFLSLSSTALFFECWFSNKRRPMLHLLNVIAVLIGTFTHYWFAFILTAQAITAVLFLRPLTKAATAILLQFCSTIPFLLLWIPILRTQLSNNSANYIPAVSLTTLAEVFGEFYGGGKAVIILFVLVALTVGNVSDPRRIFARHFWCHRSTALFLCVGFAMLFIPWLASFGRPLFLAKTAIIALPWLSLAVGSIVARAADVRTLHITTLALLLSSLFFTLRGESRHPKYDDRHTLGIINQVARPYDLVVATDLSYPLFQFYAERDGQLPVVSATPYPIEGLQHIGWTDNKRYLESPTQLDADSKTLIEAGRNATHIFVLYGEQEKIYRHLMEGFDAEFVRKAEFPFLGERHRKVIVYQNK